MINNTYRSEEQCDDVIRGVDYPLGRSIVEIRQFSLNVDLGAIIVCSNEKVAIGVRGSVSGSHSSCCLIGHCHPWQRLICASI